MSVEAMSGGSGVGTATAMNSGPITPSFGGEFSGGIKGPISIGATPDLGGTHMSGFNKAALFETFTMPAPSVDSSVGGKAVHDISPFANTEVLWQAPTVDKSKLTIPSNDAITPAKAKLDAMQILATAPINHEVFSQILDKEPPVSESLLKNSPIEQVDRIAQNIPQIIEQSNDLVSEQDSINIKEQEIKKGKIIMPTAIEQQEILADANQAIKVEEALIATGVTEEEAHKEVLDILRETKSRESLPSASIKVKPQGISTQENFLEVGKENIQNHKEIPKITYFEHDIKADDARKQTAENAVEKVTEEVASGEKDTVTGYDIAQHMPEPEPSEVKSEIAKDKDGSYESLVAQLKTAAEISTPVTANTLINDLINKNHAVRKTNSLSSREATEKEVKKVLNGEILIFES